MSDPQSTAGDPVEEPTSVDDVVGRANEGLADAEAAGRDAVGDAPAENEAPQADAAPETPETAPVVEEPAAAAPAEPVAAPDTVPNPETDAYERPESYEAVSGDGDASTEIPLEAYAASAAVPEVEPAPVEPVPVEAENAEAAYAATAVGAAGAASAVTASEPAVAAPVAPAQPIFVQAPEPPQPRGNRAAAGAIGLLAAVSFAVLYAGAAIGLGFILGDLTADNFVDQLTTMATSWTFWTPVVVFFISFWLLGAIINRGRWGSWVIFGIFVGVLTWAGFILGLFFEAPFWTLTVSEGTALFTDNLFAPLAVLGGIIAREVTIWFGAWAATRGKRVTELNLAAQHEYERTIEAGPQFVQQ